MSEHDEPSLCDEPRQTASPGEMARLFLKLGVIALGGPAAHIAIMDDEVVRRSPTAGAFLDGVNVGSLALTVAATVGLSRPALVDVPAVFSALASALLLIRYRANAARLVPGGALFGLLYAHS